MLPLRQVLTNTAVWGTEIIDNFLTEMCNAITWGRGINKGSLIIWPHLLLNIFLSYAIDRRIWFCSKGIKYSNELISFCQEVCSDWEFRITGPFAFLEIRLWCLYLIKLQITCLYMEETWNMLPHSTCGDGPYYLGLNGVPFSGGRTPQVIWKTVPAM